MGGLPKFKFVTLKPRTVWFSKQDISSTFSCGWEVSSTIADLEGGSITTRDIPIVHVVRWQGVIVTFNNRRLYTFQHALPADAVVLMKMILPPHKNYSAWAQ